MKKCFSILIIFLFLLVGCNTKTNTTSPPEIATILIPAYEKLIETDPGLNGNMNFISFDFNKLNKLSNRDKQAITNYFKNKYEVEIKKATFDELKAQGHFDEETMSLDGILLTISKLEKKSSIHYVMDGEKYRSGLGAIGLKIEVKKDNELWKVTKAPMLWIS